MTHLRKFASAALCSSLWLSPAATHAQRGAHVHGAVRLAVALDARTLTVRIDAPLDSLLGFEHRPRTTAQRQAADALLVRMNDAASLIRPDAAAQCTLARTTLTAPVLQAAPRAGATADEHAELEASVEFTCEQPDKLASLELSLFDAFQRIRRIDAQVAGPAGQSKQTLVRPEKRLRLRR